MKALLAIVLLFALGAGAAAKPSPYVTPPLGSPDKYDNTIFPGPAGAMLEADYFRAPPPPRYGGGRIFPCRAHLQSAGVTRRIVQACD